MYVLYEQRPSISHVPPCLSVSVWICPSCCHDCCWHVHLHVCAMKCLGIFPPPINSSCYFQPFNPLCHLSFPSLPISQCQQLRYTNAHLMFSKRWQTHAECNLLVMFDISCKSAHHVGLVQWLFSSAGSDWNVSAALDKWWWKPPPSGGAELWWSCNFSQSDVSNALVYGHLTAELTRFPSAAAELGTN